MDIKHTPGPWFTNDAGYLIVGGENFLVARVTSYDDEETDANARLIAAAPDYHDAAIVQQACGIPERVSLYDEEGIEGWKWTHPDGREWFAVGDWSEPPPMHPLMAAAHAKATGAKTP